MEDKDDRECTATKTATENIYPEVTVTATLTPSCEDYYNFKAITEGGGRVPTPDHSWVL